MKTTYPSKEIGTMWKYTEIDAYDSISLHDCKADLIVINGNDLVFDFPDGFWITPTSKHIDHDVPLKTGPAQLCFHDVFVDEPFNSIDIFKSTRFFGKTILCRRQQPESSTFLKLFQSQKYELEFITEYHSSITSLYQCWIWKKNSGIDSECQFEIAAKSIEYRWNEILHDRQW